MSIPNPSLVQEIYKFQNRRQNRDQRPNQDKQ